MEHCGVGVSGKLPKPEPSAREREVLPRCLQTH
jgi:hypothetical protein